MFPSFKVRTLFPLFLLMLLGCGSDQLTTAPASGTVSYDGNAVTGGTITLTPINEDGTAREGKPATGVVGTDGKFALRTYEYVEPDGAILGKHRVVYTPPEGDESEEEAPATDASGKEIGRPTKKQTGIEHELEVPESGSVVEVKTEGNDFTIALAKRAKKPREE